MLPCDPLWQRSLEHRKWWLLYNFFWIFHICTWDSILCKHVKRVWDNPRFHSNWVEYQLKVQIIVRTILFLCYFSFNSFYIVLASYVTVQIQDKNCSEKKWDRFCSNNGSGLRSSSGCRVQIMSIPWILLSYFWR